MEDVWILEIQLVTFFLSSGESQSKKKKSSAYSKVKSSLVCEFNRTQKEVGLDTISNQTALN